MVISVLRRFRCRIVPKCRSSQLKKHALDKDRSLSNLLELARTLELSDTRGRDVVALHSKQVNKIQTARARRENLPIKNSHNKNTHNKQYYVDLTIHMRMSAQHKVKNACLAEK